MQNVLYVCPDMQRQKLAEPFTPMWKGGVHVVDLVQFIAVEDKKDHGLITYLSVRNGKHSKVRPSSA